MFRFDCLFEARYLNRCALVSCNTDSIYRYKLMNDKFLPAAFLLLNAFIWTIRLVQNTIFVYTLCIDSINTIKTRYTIKTICMRVWVLGIGLADRSVGCILELSWIRWVCIKFKDPIRNKSFSLFSLQNRSIMRIWLSAVELYENLSLLVHFFLTFCLALY